VLENFLGPLRASSPSAMIECGFIDFTKALVAASDHLAMLPDMRRGPTQAKPAEALGDHCAGPEPRYRSDFPHGFGAGHFVDT